MHPPSSEDPGGPPDATGSAISSGSRLGRIWRRLPRTETLLLLVALAWTAGAKYLVVKRQRPEETLEAVTEAVLPDVLFFAAVGLLFALLYLLGRRGLLARATLLVGLVVLLWSMANAAWLIATRVQLQPGILRVLLRDPVAFWPMVQAHLVRHPAYAVPIVLTIGGGAVWIAWRLFRPAPLCRAPRYHVVCASALLVVAAGAWLGHSANVRGGQMGYSGEVLGFSSHWYALQRTVIAVAPSHDVEATRELPRAGERAIVWPDTPTGDPPNVVIVFLESVSHRVTSLADPDLATTPFFAELATQGVEFVTTRVPVPQTNKAWWTSFTGCVPDLKPDFAESVLVDRPYESLASVLAGRGYRSAFFEMSRGSFECAPGLFTNLAFDWAWFRENLEDESAHIGYMNGDDYRMFEPMFEWVDAEEGPFLLTAISSVAHDPYELPDWYEHAPADDVYASYLQTVRFTDDWLRELCARLEQRGLLDNTLLCVLGDHGEGFRPEAATGRYSPFEEVIRIPWVIRWPARVDAGRRVEWPVSQIDVTPTILTLLGADVGGAGFDGRDALAPGADKRRIHFMTWYRNAPIGYVEGDRKLVYWPYTNKLFEYDLAGDPEEKAPRTIDGPEKEQIVADLDRWRTSSHLVIPARRFRESMEYRHWRTVSSGRYAWAYYVP